MNLLEPKDKINLLIQKARQYRDEANTEVSEGLYSDDTKMVGDAIVRLLVPHGYKGIVRDAGRHILKTEKQYANEKWRKNGDELLDGCIIIVKEISINTKSLTRSGNSTRLLKKFNRLYKIKGAIPFLDNLIIVLEKINNLDLIFNNDIPHVLKKRKKFKETKEKEKAVLKSRAQDISKIARTIDLTSYPSIQASISSAIDRLYSKDHDALRHCITSCRVSIESLCMTIGNKNDWKKSLNFIFSSETDRRQVKAVHHFLGGKGLHGGHYPTIEEAEYALKMTIATLDFILKKTNKR